MEYVYILQSKADGSFYTGMSQNPAKRLEDHNFGRVKTTKSKKPWSIMHTEAFASRSEARKREKFLKSSAGREERDILLKELKRVAR